MTTVQHQSSPVAIQGSAIYHSHLLNRELSDALRMSCEKNLIRIELPEADFTIRLIPNASDGTRVRFEATFRDSSPHGGTWWSSWDIELDTSAKSYVVGATIAREIHASRHKFSYLLAPSE